MSGQRQKTIVDEKGQTWYVLGPEGSERLSLRSVEDRNLLAIENDKLVHYMLNRVMPSAFANDQIYFDTAQELRLTMLRCLELWRPEDGEVSTYCCRGLWRKLMTIVPLLRRGGGFTLTGDVVDETQQAAEDWEELYAVLDKLKPRERDAIIRGFGLRCEKVSQTALAEEYGIKRQRVHQIQVAALKKLQRLLSSSSLKPLGAASPESSPRFSVPRSRRSPPPASGPGPRQPRS